VRSSVALALALAACAPAAPAVKHGPGLAASSAKLRLAAVMWPNGKSIIYCTRRLDDEAKPVGVAGPCRRLEAGETEAMKILSWATLGRFDQAAPDAVPATLGGRCHLEITQGQRARTPTPARIEWVTPSTRTTLEEWAPTGEQAALADAFTLEASFAPEGEWMAILRVAVALGDGERVIEVPAARLIKVPACQ
jgi:hypothetical protein